MARTDQHNFINYLLKNVPGEVWDEFQATCRTLNVSMRQVLIQLTINFSRHHKRKRKAIEAPTRKPPGWNLRKENRKPKAVAQPTESAEPPFQPPPIEAHPHADAADLGDLF